MTETVHSPKKLIEVTLPLDEINAACVREKSIRHGHPSMMHLWWARRPLAAARAVIFASMVNDPGYVNKEFRHGVNKEQADAKRKELCDIIKELVIWENSNNPDVLKRANDAIKESWRELCKYNKDHPRAKELFNPEILPGFHDPFAGGGAIPLEAQRLGLESYASDLNPVPVLLNKAMIEIAPKFQNQSPVGPIPIGESEHALTEWTGNAGLAEDVRRYGLWLREKALEQTGDYYADVTITEEMAKDRPDLIGLVGKSYPIVARIWARTVKSPNPMLSNVEVPLVSTFVLSKKKGQEAYIFPQIEGSTYTFRVSPGKCPDELVQGTSAGKRAAFKCLLSGTPISYDYIREQGKSIGLGSVLMAVILNGPKGRLYISPIKTASNDIKVNKPKHLLPNDTQHFNTPLYGITTFGDLFSDRQYHSLNIFSSLISNGTLKNKILSDCAKKGLPDDLIKLCDNGTSMTAYAEAICLFMAFVVDKCADRNSTICSWDITRSGIRNTFGRQAIPMTWDYAEANIMGNSIGSWSNGLNNVYEVILGLPFNKKPGHVSQNNARTQQISLNKLVSTDPPYYDNVAYADLSDFFYLWLRKNVQDIFPDICNTLATPKQEELIANQFRQGSKQSAEKFFLDGMTEAMQSLANQAHPALPVSIYYAFKQSETKKGSTSNTGWVTFLEAVIRAGFQITGTWPMRTEMANRSVGIGCNALASSIVLICRKRSKNASCISKKHFQRELKIRLSTALDEMTGSGIYNAIAPVDLSQAIIGPGMEVFSQYQQVLEADGTRMGVDEALRMINNFLDEDAFDSHTQFCLTWFKAYSWNENEFGTADAIARAKGLSVDDIKAGGVIESGQGRVQLIHWKNLPNNWNPDEDKYVSTWEACHHLIQKHQLEGIDSAAHLLKKLVRFNGNIPMFCSTMYTLCEREGWTEDARVYNELSIAWPDIEQVASTLKDAPVQTTFDI